MTEASMNAFVLASAEDCGLEAVSLFCSGREPSLNGPCGGSSHSPSLSCGMPLWHFSCALHPHNIPPSHSRVAKICTSHLHAVYRLHCVGSLHARVDCLLL